jgi:hypothetical protein
MFKDFMQKAAVGWALRRLMDWGGWVGTFVTALVGIYNALPPSSKASVDQVLAGNWGEITLGSAWAIVLLIVSQVMSFRATTKDQVVADGTKVATPPENKAETKVIVKEAIQEKKSETLFERIFKGIKSGG